MWLVHLKVLIKTGGMEGLAAARVLASYSWQLVAKKERVADAALNPPVLAALVIPGEQEEVKQNLGGTKSISKTWQVASGQAGAPSWLAGARLQPNFQDFQPEPFSEVLHIALHQGT